MLSLESELEKEPDAFLRRALTMAVDGTSQTQIRHALEMELEVLAERDEVPSRVFEAAGGYAPTIGILGAVIGLIHVMENLTDPSKLGAGVAVAFVATIYGVGSANLDLSSGGEQAASAGRAGKPPPRDAHRRGSRRSGRLESPAHRAAVLELYCGSAA